MKKLLFVLATLFILAPTAYADYDIGEYFCEIPETLYTPPAVSFFAMPTADEILYNRFEAAILNASVDGALQRIINISVLGTGINFDTEDETYNAYYLLNIYSNVVYNNPQIGNLISGFSVLVEYEGSTKIVAIRPGFRSIYNEQAYQALETDEEKEAYLAKTHNVEAYNQAIKYAYSKAIAPDMTEDWQKLLSIHDYLADTVTYSEVIANGTDAEKSAYDSSNRFLVYTPYSALVGDRISVCQGYSLAFKLLCNMAGIECGYAVSAHHIWNIAECNGNFYHIDVTWDDPVSLGVKDLDGTIYISTSDHVLHRNFLRSDADSTALHTNEGDWTTNMPACDDSDYHGNLLFGELETIHSRISWENNAFWFEAYAHFLDKANGVVTYEPTGRYYKILSNGIFNATAAEYPPNIRLEAKMYISDKNYVAIDGTANTNADFYAAKYADDGRLIDVHKSGITFNSYGEAVADFPTGYNRLFLFENGQIKPLAYSKEM